MPLKRNPAIREHPRAGSSMRSQLIVALAGLVAIVPAVSGCLGGIGDGAEVATVASKAAAMLRAPPGATVEPTGAVREFTLYLHPMANHELYPGSSMNMWGFSLSDDPTTASFPGPEIRVTEGDRVVVTFRPLVAGFVHTIHWHGQHVPFEADGVPFITQEPVDPGAEFTYDFVARPSGTYWYHCHVDVAHHLDMGMYGAFIVEPRDPADDPPFDAETTLFLDEMDKYHIEGGNPQTQNTPQSGDPYDWLAYAQRTTQDAVNRNPRVQEAYAISNTSARPNRDWYPVNFGPYAVTLNTHLINGGAFPYTPPLFIDDGDTLRVRLVNAGDQVHAMHLHGHHVLVTHKDGVLLASPYWADTVLIAPGERYDLYVVGNNPGIWDFHDHVNANLANDHIWPGGMMTMLVYASYADRVSAGGHDHGGHAGLALRSQSGAWLRWYDELLP